MDTGPIELPSSAATCWSKGSPKQRPVNPGQSRVDALSLAQPCFAAIAKDAGQAGGTYCVEPLVGAGTPLITMVAQAAAMVEAIGSPAVRTMIDICAAGQNQAATIPDVIERWLPTGLIAHSHLNVPNRRTPGEGNLRFGPHSGCPLAPALCRNLLGRAVRLQPDGRTCAATPAGGMNSISPGIGVRRPAFRSPWRCRSRAPPLIMPSRLQAVGRLVHRTHPAEGP